jgi:micrococcal nuclease
MSMISAQRRIFRLLLATCAAILLAACSSEPPEPPPTQTLDAPGPTVQAIVTAKVVAVLDGVTIDVEIAGEVFRVRYLGIDVPGPGPGLDPAITARALDFNRFRVLGRDVEIERDGVDVDDAGRLLRYVYVDGEMVNKAMLDGGYAVVAGFPAEFVQRVSFTQAETAAQQDGRGYWRDVDERNFTQEDLVEDADHDTPTPESAEVPQFRGGTLPLPPGADGDTCDFTGTREAVIKGNVDSDTGERIYIMPGSIFYSTTIVDTDDGDAWICTEDEAIATGWTKAKH